MGTPFHALARSITAPIDPPDLSTLGDEQSRLRAIAEKWAREPAGVLAGLLELQEAFGHLPVEVRLGPAHLVVAAPAAVGSATR